MGSLFFFFLSAAFQYSFILVNKYMFIFGHKFLYTHKFRFSLSLSLCLALVWLSSVGDVVVALWHPCFRSIESIKLFFQCFFMMIFFGGVGVPIDLAFMKFTTSTRVIISCQMLFICCSWSWYLFVTLLMKCIITE